MLFADVLSIKEKSLGEERHDVADGLIKVADVGSARGYYAEAESPCRRAPSILTRGPWCTVPSPRKMKKGIRLYSRRGSLDIRSLNENSSASVHRKKNSEDCALMGVKAAIRVSGAERDYSRVDG